MTWILLLAIAVNVGSLWLQVRARRFDRAAAAALRHARTLHDELTLILIENDRLRREGVWQDGDRWHARYVVETAGASGGEAKAAMMAALSAAARVVPFRQRLH